MDLGWLVKYIGAPYNERGNSVVEGFDCYSLVVAIGKELGINYPLPKYSFELSERQMLVDKHRGLFTRVEVPQLGDLVTLRMGRFVAHFGVMVSRNKFIHATDKTGVIVSHSSSIQYKQRIEGFYRCKQN